MTRGHVIETGRPQHITVHSNVGQAGQAKQKRHDLRPGHRPARVEQTVAHTLGDSVGNRPPDLPIRPMTRGHVHETGRPQP